MLKDDERMYLLGNQSFVVHNNASPLYIFHQLQQFSLKYFKIPLLYFMNILCKRIGPKTWACVSFRRSWSFSRSYPPITHHCNIKDMNIWYIVCYLYSGGSAYLHEGTLVFIFQKCFYWHWCISLSCLWEMLLVLAFC